MGEFLTSISWAGWVLIVLALATVWQLPAIVRMLLSGKWRDPRAHLAPEDQPDTPPPADPARDDRP